MLRIIGGEHRGRKLELPRSVTVRPMTDRVREAIFNLFRQLTPGREALDLFAGSGAIGLEALSRGATRALFVESDARVAALLRRNIAALGYQARATVTVGDVYRWARRDHDWPREPALAFVAPPYGHFQSRLPELVAVLQTLIARLPEDSAIAIQAPKTISATDMPGGQDWELRRYGETNLIICQTARPAL